MQTLTPESAARRSTSRQKGIAISSHWYSRTSRNWLSQGVTIHDG